MDNPCEHNGYVITAHADGLAPGQWQSQLLVERDGFVPEGMDVSPLCMGARAAEQQALLAGLPCSPQRGPREIQRLLPDHGSRPGRERERNKQAYRKLAHQFHPAISKEPRGKERFQEIGEAYAELKDPEKRQAYDQLGKPPVGQDFSPPLGWQNNFEDRKASYDDVDLAD